MRKLWKNNSLSIVIFAIFAVALIGMSITGWLDTNNELTDRQQPTQSYGAYIISGDFIEGVFENWESEFLQMWALVVLTIFLKQKGADDSKPMRGTTMQDTNSRYSIIRAANWRQRRQAIGHGLYAHSLGLVLIAIFFVSFCLHAIGGTQMYNEDAEYYGNETVSVIQYVGTSRFWYESLQNWQSEFLAVGALLLLSIKLRERGSPESKPVGKAHDQTTGTG